MGAACSACVVPGLPSCYGNSHPMLQAAKTGDDAHLHEAAASEPLLLLACTMRHATLVAQAAQQGRSETLRTLIGLVASHAAALSARLAEFAARDDASPDLVAALKRGREARLLQPERVLATLLSWPDRSGMSPLMLAARAGHVEVITLLLEHGADPLMVDKVSRKSALHFATTSGHVRAVHALLNRFHTVVQPQLDGEDGEDEGGGEARLVLLQDAELRDGHSGRIRFVDLRSRSGLSALHAAAFWGFTGCVRALLTGGASIAEPLIIAHGSQCKLPVHGRSTALHLAAEAGHTAIVVLLLHAHAERMARLLSTPVADMPARERLPWEGSRVHDPRLAKNSEGDTPHDRALCLRGPKGLLQLLLDPAVPLNWVLTEALARHFNGPPHLGVTQLAVLAKSALDTHLLGGLDQLQEAQEEQQQPTSARKGLSRAASELPPLASSAPASAAKAAAAAAAAAAASAAASAAAATACCKPPGAGADASAWHSPSCSSLSSLTGSRGLGSSSSLSSHALGGLASRDSFASMGDAALAESEIQEASDDDEEASLFNDGGDDDSDADSSAGEATCAICFDARASVMVASCRHCLCGGCARSLLVAASISKPARCPFCRRGVAEFVAAPTLL